MAESVQHEGWNLSAHVDFSEIEKANKAADSLFSNLKRVDSRFSSTHANSSLPREISHVDSLTASYVNRLKSEGNAYEANKAKLTGYQNAVGSLTNKQRSLKGELGRIAQETGKSSDAYKRQQIRINDTATSINKYSSKIKESQAEVSRLRPDGFNRLANGAKHVTNAADKMKSGMHNAWQNAKAGASVAAAGIAAVGTAAVSGANKTANLQQRYKEITNLATLGGEKQKNVIHSVAQMESQGRDMSIKYGKSQQEIASGYEDLVKRGYTTKQALGAMRTEVQASVGTGDKFNDVTTVSSQVLEAFGMRAKGTRRMVKNTSTAVNELAYSANATSTGFQSLGIGMSYVGAAAHNAKISLAETASAMGVLSNNGLEADKAGTGLRNVINNIVSQTNKIPSGKGVFSKLGIKKSEIVDNTGHIKSLSSAMDVIYDHIKRKTADNTAQQGYFKSIFGTTGEQAGLILAKNTGELKNLTKATADAGSKGKYVSELAAKNSATAKMQSARAKQAINAFTMDLGAKLLPAINAAGNELAKFLTSGDGKKFEKDVGNAVGSVAQDLVNLVKWVATHKTAMKFIGGGILAGYSALKGAQFITFLNKTRVSFENLRNTSKVVNGLSDSINDLFGAENKFNGKHSATNGSASPLSGMLQSVKSAGSIKKMSKAGKIALAGSVIFNGAQVAQNLHNATQTSSARSRFKDTGSGVGEIVGTGLGAYFGGAEGALVGGNIGSTVGKTAGNSFYKTFGDQVAFNVQTKGGLTKETLNGYYGKNNKFHDQRNSGEKAWGMTHRMNIWSIVHPKDPLDFVSGTLSLGYNMLGHAADASWWKRSVPYVNAQSKGTWLDSLTNLQPHISGKKPSISKMKLSRASLLPHVDVDKWLKGITNKISKLKWPKIHFPKFKLPKIEFGSWIKNAKKSFKPFNKWWSGTWKGINSNRYVKAFKKGRFVQTGLHDIEKNTRKFRQRFGKYWSNTWKGINSNRYVKAFKKGRLIRTGLSDIEKNTRKFRQKFGSYWSNTWKGVNNNRYVKAFKKGRFFSTALSDITSRWRAFTKWFGSNWNNFWGGLGRNLKSFWNGIKSFGKTADNDIKGSINNVLGAGNNINRAFGGNGKAFHYLKHAAGGHITKNHNALVGEEGPELAYRNTGASARLLGVNGPQVAKVHSGEHILNARDTSRVMHGGLGNGLVLPGYAKGNTGLKKNDRSVVNNVNRTGKSVTSRIKKTDRSVFNGIKKTGKKVVNNVKQTGNKSSKSLTRFAKSSNQTWHKIASQTNKQTNRTRRDAVADYTTMYRKVRKQMGNMHSSVTRTAKSTATSFGKALEKMKGYARNAMKDTIGELNQGIKGIDKVLSQFGGNGSVIKPVHFAAGSNGALDHNTLAMVNDATTGPRQEAVVKDNNDIIIPSGKNRIMPIKKNWKVLNGGQTQELAHSWGLSHFAKGSGVSHSQLRKIAARGSDNPKRSFDNDFTVNVKIKQPQIEKGTTGLGKRAAEQFGVPWMKAMWQVINDAIGEGAGKGGTREAFLKYAESHFAGKPYRMGGMGPTYYDCSGMIAKALSHFGINIGRTTTAMSSSAGTQYLGKSLSKTIPGDIVIYGHGNGAAGHVGIIKNPSAHSMFNETPPRATTSSIDAPKSMGYGYYRIRGLRNAKQKNNRANKRLMSLARRELGHAAIAWIKKHLSESLGMSGAFSLGGDIGARAHALAKAFRSADPSATRAGIAAVIGNWLFESGLNPSAANSSGAIGLGQWLGGRASALRAFAKRHGMKWNSPAAQINYALHGDGSDSSVLRSVLNGGGSVTGLAAKFSNQWERGGYTAQHVNGAKQIASALGYANGGDPVVGQTVKVGEHGPELAKFKDPVHIYSNSDSKKKFNVDNLIKKVHVKKPKPKKVIKPVINININGDISSKHEAKDVANVISRKLVDLFEKIGDEFGTDPEVY